MSQDFLSQYPPLMTVDQVAEVLQVDRRSLFNWRRDGDGPPFTRIGSGSGAIRYPREDLRAYLAERTARISQ